MGVISHPRSTAEWIGTVRSVTPDVWDDVASCGSLYRSHAWLAGEEAVPGMTVAYAVVRSAAAGDGTDIDGAVAAYVVDRERNPRYAPCDLGLGRTGGPVALYGARRGYHNGLGAAVSRASYELLVEEIAGHAARHGGGWWLYVTDAEVDRLRQSVGVDVPRFLGLEATLELPGAGFEDYLDGFTSRRRRKIQAEDRRFRRRGLTSEEVALAGYIPTAARLLDNLNLRYGGTSDRPGLEEYFRRLGESVNPGRLLICRDATEKDPLAFLHFYDFAGTRWARSIGFDYDRLDGEEYFSMAFYEPIRSAYTAHLGRLHLGMDSLHAKALRGAALSPLWAVPAIAAEQHGREWRTANREDLDRVLDDRVIASRVGVENWRAYS